MIPLVTITNDEDDILRTRAEEVSDDELNHVFQLAQVLKVTIYQSGKLVGLAANQIGVAKRIMAVVRDHTGIIQAMINPEIIATSSERATEPEGCDSIPGVLVDVNRPVKIHALWVDVTGKKHEVWMEGLESRIFQHELDHLDGKLITDYASPYPA